MSKISERGVAVVETLLILLALGLVGFVGYKVYQANHSADELYEQSTSEPDSSASSSSDVPAVNSAADLDSASKALDEQNLEQSDSDSSQLDSQLQAF